MTVVLKGKSAVASASVKHNKGELKSLDVTPPGAPVVSTLPMANVGYSTQFTKNLGDYESVRVSVSLNLPVPMPPPGTVLTKELDGAFKYVSEWVDAKMQEVLTELEETLR